MSKFFDENIDSYCGLSCKDCEYALKCNCGGCIATNGNPFHGDCVVAKCCNKMNIRFCGECINFPCELLISFSDDEEHGDKPKGERVRRCLEQKNALVKEARDGKDEIGYCGHNCDFCFYGKWCGGCRSDYNCCSFATLFADKVCPNVKCANEKGYSGCYSCDELEGCEKGYFGNKNEYVAKATAIFTKKHGLELYKKTLLKAIINGVNYPKDFDATGSVDEALKLLESFIDK